MEVMMMYEARGIEWNAYLYLTLRFCTYFAHMGHLQNYLILESWTWTDRAFLESWTWTDRAFQLFCGDTEMPPSSFSSATT